jgi:hypothetical protein
MKWQALKEWSISFVIALVPFLLVLGALLVPRQVALGDFGGVTVEKKCLGLECDSGCGTCNPDENKSKCEQDPNDPLGTKCECSKVSQKAEDCALCLCQPIHDKMRDI